MGVLPLSWRHPCWLSLKRPSRGCRVPAMRDGPPYWATGSSRSVAFATAMCFGPRLGAFLCQRCTAFVGGESKKPIGKGSIFRCLRNSAQDGPGLSTGWISTTKSPRKADNIVDYALIDEEKLGPCRRSLEWHRRFSATQWQTPAS